MADFSRLDSLLSLIVGGVANAVPPLAEGFTDDASPIGMPVEAKMVEIRTLTNKAIQDGTRTLRLDRGKIKKSIKTAINRELKSATAFAAVSASKIFYAGMEQVPVGFGKNKGVKEELIESRNVEKIPVVLLKSDERNISKKGHEEAKIGDIAFLSDADNTNDVIAVGLQSIPPNPSAVKTSMQASVKTKKRLVRMNSECLEKNKEILPSKLPEVALMPETIDKTMHELKNILTGKPKFFASLDDIGVSSVAISPLTIGQKGMTVESSNVAIKKAAKVDLDEFFHSSFKGDIFITKDGMPFVVCCESFSCIVNQVSVGALNMSVASGIKAHITPFCGDVKVAKNKTLIFKKTDKITTSSGAVLANEVELCSKCKEIVSHRKKDFVYLGMNVASFLKTFKCSTLEPNCIK